MSQKITIGDWRALLCKQTSVWELQIVETEARTSLLPDSYPFALYAADIGTAMRKRHPVPDGAKSKEFWTDIAGNHPSSDKLQTAMFRMAILEAIPKPVRETMLNDPNLPFGTTEYWERHLKHHMKQYSAKREEEKLSTDTAHAQLVKLQLAESKRATESKHN